MVQNWQVLTPLAHTAQVVLFSQDEIIITQAQTWTLGDKGLQFVMHTVHVYM